MRVNGPGLITNDEPLMQRQPVGASGVREVRRGTLPTWRPRSSLLKVRAFAYLAMIDCFAIATGFGLVAAVRAASTDGSGDIVFALVLIPLFLVVAANMHAYAAYNLQDPFRAIRRGAQALVLAVSTLILAVFYTKSSEAVPRLTIGLGSLGALGLVSLGRYLFVRHLHTLVGGNPLSAILICDGEQPVATGEFSLVMPAASFFDPDSDDPLMYDRLAKSLETADRVVIACPPHRRAAWARALRGTNIQGEIMIPELADLSPVGMGPVGDQPSVIVAVGPLSLFDRLIKRMFDLTVAGLGLLLLAPLMVAVAISIKLDSPGPVLFQQVRIGRGNQMFRVKKFRSMHVNSTDRAGDRSASRDDDRVTRVGRFIRRTSIDELPQLINVLLGSMSIVGPRPHALGSRAANKLFWEVDQRYWDRHAAKPGLTGLAQVRGFRGATLAEDDLRNRLQADLEYLESWSIWRDLKIMFLTARVILHRNAF